MALGLLGKAEPTYPAGTLEYVVGPSGTWFRQDQNGFRMDTPECLRFYAPRGTAFGIQEDRTCR